MSIFPRQWLWAWNELRRLSGLRSTVLLRVALLVGLSTLFESAGVAILLPILEFIQGSNSGAPLGGGFLSRQAAALMAMLNIPLTLTSLVTVLFVMVVLRELTAFVSRYSFDSLTWNLERTLRDKLTHDAFCARPLRTDLIGTGGFVEFFTNQCRISAQLLVYVVELFQLVMTTLGYGAILLITAPYATLAIAPVLVIGVVSTSWFVSFSRQKSRELVGEQQYYSGLISERYVARRLIKLADAEEREVDRLAGSTRQLFQLQRALTWSAAFSRMILMVGLVGLTLLALVLSVKLLDLTVPVIALALLVVMRLLPVALSFQQFRQGIAARLANLERVVEMDGVLQASAERRVGGQPFDGLKNAIVLKDVDVRYPAGDVLALHQVSLTIPANRMTAIIGPSGAGKSTLVDLMALLVEPAAGSVEFDGVPSQLIHLSSLRRHIAFMPQQAVLFRASVLDNVRYFRPDAPLDEVKAACRRAYADGFIDKLPNGYDTLLGEGGGNLSGGQRQRLALARALLSKADLLVLDEPTSAVDSHSEAMIQQALDEVMEARSTTLVVIAHRMSTIQKADHIIVLEKGRVIREGTPEMLKNEDGWYRRMLGLDQHAPKSETVTP